jgi:hypothetical protein
MIAGKKNLTGGTRPSVRERGRGRGAGPVRLLLGLVRVVWAPGTAQVGLASSFFFDLFPFSFYFRFLFWFLKMLYKFDLNKIKSDHF